MEAFEIAIIKEQVGDIRMLILLMPMRIWICESKWWETRKVGRGIVEAMIRLSEKLRDFEGREYFKPEAPLITLRVWLFAHNGVTSDAKNLLEKHQIYWSDRSDLDALIQEAGIRRLPTFGDTAAEEGNMR